MHRPADSAGSTIDVAAAVISRCDGSFLLAQRPAGKPYAGYWEFPGGKVVSGEALLQTLGREMMEELGIRVRHACPWITRIFAYPHATVRLHFYRVTQWHGEPYPREGQALAWQYADKVSVAPLLPANLPVLQALCLPPVYAITNAMETGSRLALVQIEQALRSGLRLLQVREKGMKRELLRSFAASTLALARRHDARVLINDDDALCREIGADGVHLPAARLMQMDRPLDGDFCGASCHNAEELAQAERMGVRFAVLSPVLPTPSHPDLRPLGWRRFSRLLREYPLPVYALGGLRHGDLATAMTHGAHGIAMMRAVAGTDASAPEPQATIR